MAFITEKVIGEVALIWKLVDYCLWQHPFYVFHHWWRDHPIVQSLIKNSKGNCKIPKLDWVELQVKKMRKYRIIISPILREEHVQTCHMCIRPRYPASSHSVWPYMDFNQRSKLPVRHFLCTRSSSMSKSHLVTCSTASSRNGCMFPWRTDSSRSLCQNSWNAGSSIRISSWTTYMN